MAKVLDVDRGAALRALGTAVAQGVPGEGVAAGDRPDGAAEHLPQLPRTRRAAHRAPDRHACSCRSSRGATLNAFYATLAKEGCIRSQRGLSPATVRRIHATMHRALRDADALEPSRGQPGQRRRSAEGLSRRAQAAGLVGRAAVRLPGEREGRPPLRPWHFLAITGCRRGEALGLQWENVDLDKSRVTIAKALLEVEGELLLSEPKTHRGRRTIALDPETVAVLKAHHRRQAEERLRAGAAGTTPASCSPPRTVLLCSRGG